MSQIERNRPRITLPSLQLTGELQGRGREAVVPAKPHVEPKHQQYVGQSHPSPRTILDQLRALEVGAANQQARLSEISYRREFTALSDCKQEPGQINRQVIDNLFKRFNLETSITVGLVGVAAGISSFIGIAPQTGILHLILILALGVMARRFKITNYHMDTSKKLVDPTFATNSLRVLSELINRHSTVRQAARFGLSTEDFAKNFLANKCGIEILSSHKLREILKQLHKTAASFWQPADKRVNALLGLGAVYSTFHGLVPMQEDIKPLARKLCLHRNPKIAQTAQELLTLCEKVDVACEKVPHTF